MNLLKKASRTCRIPVMLLSVWLIYVAWIIFKGPIDYKPIEKNSKKNKDKLTYHMHTTGSYSDAIVLIKWFNG